jgi:ribosomal protein S18 acetylase RimI-like enzyme
MHAPVIRRAAATEEDVALVAPLFDAYRQFYGRPTDPALARAFVGERLRGGESVVFLALAGGAAGETGGETALGFTQLYPSFSSVSAARLWILNDLFVTPEARGLGVGHRLLEAARDHARATGARRLLLSTARANTGAQRLYEAFGYERDDQYLHYALELAPASARG